MKCICWHHIWWYKSTNLVNVYVVLPLLHLCGAKFKVEYYVDAEYENPLKHSEKNNVLVKGYFIQ